MSAAALLQIVGGILAGAVVPLLIAVLANRRTLRGSRDDRAASTRDRDAVWNADYRAYAEKHIGWDYMILARLQRVEQNQGINEPIPEPPPLFPRLDASS